METDNLHASGEETSPISADKEDTNTPKEYVGPGDNERRHAKSWLGRFKRFFGGSESPDGETRDPGLNPTDEATPDSNFTPPLDEPPSEEREGAVPKEGDLSSPGESPSPSESPTSFPTPAGEEPNDPGKGAK